MSYEVGSQYRTSYVVRDALLAYISPTTISLDIVKPDGTLITPSPTPTEDSEGHFHYDHTFVVEGLHKFLWSSTGPVTHKTDYANASEWRSIVGLDEARTFLGETDTTRDSILRKVLATTTELVENVVGVCIRRTFTAERVPGFNKAVIQLPHPPLPSDDVDITIQSVWPGGPIWKNDYTTDPANPAIALIVYPDSGTVEPINMIGFWYGPWKATYTAGRLVIPECIQLAVQEIVFDLWAIQRPYGAVDLEPGPQETAQYEAMLAQYTIPPHAKAMLDTEALPGFGG